MSDRSVLDEQFSLAHQQCGVGRQDQVNPTGPQNQTAAQCGGIVANIKNIRHDIGRGNLDQSRTVQFAVEPVADLSVGNRNGRSNLTGGAGT